MEVGLITECKHNNFAIDQIALKMPISKRVARHTSPWQRMPLLILAKRGIISPHTLKVSKGLARGGRRRCISGSIGGPACGCGGLNQQILLQRRRGRCTSLGLWGGRRSNQPHLALDLRDFIHKEVIVVLHIAQLRSDVASDCCRGRPKARYTHFRHPPQDASDDLLLV